ncbi:capsule assembly Wzi family protein [Larkinella ripae]
MPLGIVRLGSSGVFYKDSTRRGWAFGYGAELVGNAGPAGRLLLPEAYVTIRNGSFELLAGRRKDVVGLVDSTLSSGSYSWSTNALPLPKIQLGTRGFIPLHFTGDLIAINAFFAHAWFTRTDSVKKSFLHQKAFYGRVGKPNWKVKLFGGIVHNVQWGGRSEYLGIGSSVSGQLPSSFKDFLHVIVAKPPVQNNSVSYHDRVNQLGNHVGSIDLGAEITFPKWDALAYYQHPFEDKSGIAFMNFPDGLYGFQLKRRSIEGPYPVFRFNRLLFEYLTTLDQSGNTIETRYTMYQGIDDYFNNFQYKDGWANAQTILGTPFLSRRPDVKERWQNVPGKYELMVVNNRVAVFHVGLEGKFASGTQLMTRFSVSQNYGTYRNPFGQSANQFSGVIWLKWPAKWLGGTELNTAVALDNGNLYTKSLGGWISLKKIWNR